MPAVAVADVVAANAYADEDDEVWNGSRQSGQEEGKKECFASAKAQRVYTVYMYRSLSFVTAAAAVVQLEVDDDG